MTTTSEHRSIPFLIAAVWTSATAGGCGGSRGHALPTNLSSMETPSLWVGRNVIV